MPLFHKANMAHKPVEILSEQLDKRSDGSQEHVESDGNDFFFFASKVFEGFNESELDKMYEMRKKMVICIFFECTQVPDPDESTGIPFQAA
uniref:Uncharacterized protein n=1 Tax=Oryza meridionalis TaxID=40149 RepID=A0A0E0D5Y1_9ORYZ